MALVACPECQNQISTMAVSCPKCGAPISAIAKGDTAALGQSVTTTEQTSKALKLRMAIAVVVMVVSIVGALAVSNDRENPGLGAVFILAFLGSAIYYFYIRFKVWWHHR